jgi:hypothetical protein
MRQAEVKQALADGHTVFVANVSGKQANVIITGESRYGGWNAVNQATRRAVRIKSAARLHGITGTSDV